MDNDIKYNIEAILIKHFLDNKTYVNINQTIYAAKGITNTIVESIDNEKTSKNTMTAGCYCNMLTNFAKDYVKIAEKSVIRNNHMNNYTKKEIDQDLIDAIIVDFINYVGGGMCMDYGLYTRHLSE